MKLKKRIVAGLIAFIVAVSPLQTSIAAFADEITNDSETQVEETQPEPTSAPVETTVTEKAVETESLAETTESYQEPDYSEFAEPTETAEIDSTSEPTESTIETVSVVDNEATESEVAETTTEETTASVETVAASEPSETSVTSETTQETEPEVTDPEESASVESVEETKNNIVFANSADEYYKLVASLPDGNRVVVDTKADLSYLEGASGVYFDGTYILMFDTQDNYNKAVQAIYDAGYDYLIDGTLSACGNFGGFISYGSLNSNATVKVAVIDTGSNLANEKYSVIGNDVADHNGHGTAMCNYILDETSNAYIISIKALGDNAQGNMSDVYAAVQLAEDLGVDYILLAMNIRNTGKYDAFESLIKGTKAKVVASAGNNGTDAVKYIPAGIPGVITVGAIGDGNELRSFSNYGTCVEYYDVADSTSEASAKVLGKLIAGEYVTTVAFRTDCDIYYYQGSENYFEANYTNHSTKYLEVMTYSDMNGYTSDQFRSRVLNWCSNNLGYSIAGGCIDFVLRSYEYARSGNINGHFTSGTGFPFNHNDYGTNSFMRAAGHGASNNVGLTGLYVGSDVDDCITSGRAFYNYVTANATPGDIIFFGDSSSGSNAWRHTAIYWKTGSESFGGTAQPGIWVYESPGTGGSGHTRFINAADFRITNGISDSKAFNSVLILKVAETPTTVPFSITKASANPSVTNGNSCYDLNGTTYVLYSDAACTTAVATFTVDAAGQTTTVYEVDIGSTYYLRETVAGKGYNIDVRTYQVKVNSDATVTVKNDLGTEISVTKSGNTFYAAMTDVPGNDPLTINLRKVDKAGNIVHNATLSGAVFQLSYYAQDLGASGNNDATPTVVYNVTVSGNSSSIRLSDVRNLIPVGGSDPTYLSSLPNDWFNYPYGTIRIQEITAPAGYKVNDQVVRYRLLSDGSVPYYLESNSSYGNGNRNYWAHQQDGSWDLTEFPTVGYYALTKALDDTNTRSSLAGFQYELYNTSSTESPVLIATGVSQSDGRILWTYTVPNYYKNTDDTVLLTGTTTYELELPATEKNASGSEVAIQYQVRELFNNIGITYGDTSIPYTYTTPDGWTKGSTYFYKNITVNSDDSVKRETVANNYEYTGLNVSKVVPTGNAFDMTKVSFKLYNTDGGTDTLIANGVVDSRGNVTWYKIAQSGYGTSPNSSVNIINYLPLGHYRIEETWDKEYLDLNASVSILIEEQNNNGWTKTETRTSYTYTYDIDLSSAANDGSTFALAVENEKKVQQFNLTKSVTTEGDASTIDFELYCISGGNEFRIATGTVTTDGTVGDFGVTWTFQGKHSTVNGLDTLELPIGDYRIVEKCPVTYYGSTNIPFTYMTPAGYTARTVNGELEFCKEFTLSAGSYESVKSQVIENTRIESEFEIIKVERSATAGSKTFTFEVYYRGNGTSAANVGNFDSSFLLESVQIVTSQGEGSATLKGIPEGWYEIREVGADSKWITHWANETSVTNGNKVVRASSENRTIATPSVDDGIELNGGKISAVVCYNDIKPEIRTTLIDRGTDSHVTTYSETAELDDDIRYENLMPGTYTASGVLMDKVSGDAYLDKEGKEVTGQTTFTVPTVLDKYGQPVPQTGHATVTFTLDTTTIEGKVLVAFEELHAGASIEGELKAEHKDIDDVDQTVEVPEIHTTATTDNGTHTFTYNERVNIDDRVEYKGLVVGRSYRATGTLMDAATGEIYKDSEGKTYTASTEFKAEQADGFVVVSFKNVLIPYEKTTIVVFEEVEDIEKTVTVAVHADLEDKDQTVERPIVGTTATVNNAKAVWLGTTEVQNITISDKLAYEGLSVGNQYRAEANLYLVRDGVATQLMANGLPVVSMVVFTPTETNGSVVVNITFSTEGLAEGDKIVVFEKVYDVATEVEIQAGTQTEDLLIAKHEDLNDNDQTITIHFRPMTGGIVPSYSVVGAVIAAISAAIACAWFFISRKKRLEKA